MKKTIKVGAFAFAGALLFTSCKKDWVCVCQYEENYPIPNQTKKDAEQSCEGSSQVGFVTLPGFKQCYLQED